MTACRVFPVAFLTGVLFVSGCGTYSSSFDRLNDPEALDGWNTVGSGSSAVAILGVDAARLFLGATEGDVIEEIDTGPEMPTRPAGTGGGLGLTAHAGVFMAGGTSDFTFDPSYVIGAIYELRVLRSKSFALELGADFTSISNADREMDSTMILLSASARFTPGAGSLYVTGSGTMLLESYTDGQRSESGSNVVPLVGFGAGFRPPEARWDARVGYSFLVGSQNLLGIIALTGGYTF